MKKVLIFTFGILCTLVSLSAQEFTLNNNNFYHNTHTADIMDTHDPFLSMVAYPIGMTTNQFETEFNRRSYVSDLDWNVYCNFSTLSTLLREKEYPKYFIDMWAPVENTTEISKAWRRNLSNELDKLLDGNIDIEQYLTNCSYFNDEFEFFSNYAKTIYEHNVQLLLQIGIITQEELDQEAQELNFTEST